jgi:hypothetical protein
MRPGAIVCVYVLRLEDWEVDLWNFNSGRINL